MASLSDLLFGGSTMAPTSSVASQRLASLQTKYTTRLPIAQLQSQFGPDVVNSLLKFETDRANRGVSPLSTQKTLDVLTAASKKKPVTEAPSRDPLDLFGNIASDVGQIVTSIPKLPAALFHEVEALPTLPAKLAKAKSLGDYLSLPGVRLIPGAYTAKNLAEGNFSELVSHPVQTALDVAPFAGKLELGTKIGEIGVGDSTVGEQLSRGKKALGRTLPGRFAKQAWGSQSRGLTKIFAEEGVGINQAANPALASQFPGRLNDIRRAGSVADADFKRLVSPERQPLIKAALETDTLDSLQLTNDELGAVNRLRDVGDQYRKLKLDTDRLQERVVNGTPEILTNTQAEPLDALTAKIEKSRLVVDLHRNVLDPTIRPISDLLSRSSETILNEATSGPLRKTVAQGLIHSMDAAGYEVSAELRTLATKVSKKTNASFMDQVNALATTTPSTPRPVAYSAEIAKAPELLGPEGSATRWLARTENESTRLLRTSEKLAAKEASTVPARWQPLVAETKRLKISDYTTTHLTPDDPRLPEVLQFINERNYGFLPEDVISKEQIAAFQKEAVASIADLKAQGINPEYVHHVPLGAAKSLGHPTLSSVVPKPSSISDRVLDWTPTDDSFSVAISHEGAELAKEAASRTALDRARDAYAVTVGQVREELLPTARRIAARNGTDVAAEFEKLVSRDMVRWSDTEKGFVADAARAPKLSALNTMADTDLLFPRHLSDVLTQMASPPPFSRLLDPLTQVLRYAVLPFSPRFQVNNIGGGAIMGALEEPRVLLELRKAWKVMKEFRNVNKALAKGVDASLSPTVQEIVDHLPPGTVRKLSSMEFAHTPEGNFQLAAGGKLGSLMKQAAFLGRGIKNAADYSFGINQFIDDVYTLAAQSAGEKIALKAGETAEDAAAAGEALVNKIQPRWLEMTPMERSILRPIIPFYSFLSHVFRYAYRYPIDHPWRIGVIDAFARTELDDFNTGLPQALASAFFLGSPDSSGNQTAIDIGAMNPFRNLGDDLTIAGFMSEMNPLFKSALTQVGYDPAQRGPDIYPEVQYDPRTGGFKAIPLNTPSFVGQVASGFIPQLNIIAALTGTSRTFKDMMKTNPEAAQRMLASQAGIPLLWKNVNVYESRFKSELNRQTSQQNALSKAIKSGNYTDASRYPSLAPKLAALQAKNQPSATAAQAQIRWDQG